MNRGASDGCVEARVELLAQAAAEAEVRGVHPQGVGIGARRLRRFTVAPLKALAEFQPPRLIHAEAA